MLSQNLVRAVTFDLLCARIPTDHTALGVEHVDRVVLDAVEQQSKHFSWNRAEALGRLGGDEDLFRDLCRIFLEESPKLLRKLRQAVAEGDAAAVMCAAHSLKGEVGYLGAGEASQAARELEDMGRENKLGAAPETLILLEREISGLHFAVKDPVGVLQ